MKKGKLIGLGNPVTSVMKVVTEYFLASSASFVKLIQYSSTFDKTTSIFVLTLLTTADTFMILNYIVLVREDKIHKHSQINGHEPYN